MNPKLIYLYIHTIGRTLDQQEFCFTNDFKIKFLKNEKKLIIEPKYNPYIGLWGDHIENINLIVGKNGTGKTTILDFLGSNRSRRNRIFDQQPIQDQKWFAVYHINDNNFVIEGYDSDLINNLRKLPHNTSYSYSVYINYDYKNQEGIYLGYTQLRNTPDSETTLEKKMVTLYFSNNRARNWYDTTIEHQTQEYGVEFTKLLLNQPQYSNIYKFVTEEYSKWQHEHPFTELNCTLTLVEPSFEDAWGKNEKLERITLELYRSKDKILTFDAENEISLPGLKKEKNTDKKWSKKQRFIISYLENIIIKTWLEFIKKEDKIKFNTEIKKIDFKVDDFNNRINYLLEIIKTIESLIKKEDDYPLVDEFLFNPSIIKDFVNLLKALKDEYFSSYHTITISLTDKFQEDIRNVLINLDVLNHKYWGFDRDIDIKFKHLSTGEIEFINGFSTLFTAIDIALNEKGIGSILILIDEPDAYFHPEWSRKYIKNLVDFFENTHFDKKIKYQFIITTHSPFIVSDIPKEHITCMTIDTDSHSKRVTKKAEFGLMSNFYDILKNDFFINSPIGEYAKIIFKKLINDIDSLPLINEEKQQDEIKRIEGIIITIGEEILQKKLLQLLQNKKKSLFPMNNKDKRIEELEKELAILKMERDYL